MTSTAREAFLALMQADPTMNQSQLASQLGISRQRVSQIARAEGFTLPRGVQGVGKRHSQAPPAARVLTGGVPTKIASTVVGTIGELLAAADLMARGYAVFFPFTRTAACDLIALNRRGRPLMIEVRCGARRGERIVFAKKEDSPADHYAVVLTGEPVWYVPELAP